MSNPNAADISAKREIAISGILEAAGFKNSEGVAEVMDAETAKELDDFFRVNSAYRLGIIRFLTEAAHKAGVEEGKKQRRRKPKPEAQEEENDATEPVAEPG